MKFKDILKELLKPNKRKFLIVCEDEKLFEGKNYKVPGTTRNAIYDPGNTNTKTKDHFHIYTKNGKQLYAINRDKTSHDGSKAKLSKKEIKFLKSHNFDVPENGILEWTSLVTIKHYYYTILS